MKNILLSSLLIILAACSSLEKKSSQLNVGSTGSDVIKVMGTAPYKYEDKGVEALRYAVVAGFGYCDYREFYIYRDSLIHINNYHHASIGGCTVGLQDIDWSLVLTKSEQYDKNNPVKTEPSGSGSLVQDLKDLNDLKQSGALTEAEYQQVKKSLLNNGKL